MTPSSSTVRQNNRHGHSKMRTYPTQPHPVHGAGSRCLLHKSLYILPAHLRKGSEGTGPSGSPGVPSPDEPGLAGVWVCVPQTINLSGGWAGKVRIAFLLTKNYPSRRLSAASRTRTRLRL